MGQEITDDLRHDRRATLTAAHMHLEPDLAGVVLHQAQADIVHADGGAVLRGARDRDLELARQPGEFGVRGGPLPDQLAPGARIGDLVRRSARERVGRGVADGVARSLDGVHLHARQMIKHVWNIHQRRPVVLDVLACGEMAVTAIIRTRHIGERTQLL